MAIISKSCSWIANQFLSRRQVEAREVRFGLDATTDAVLMLSGTTQAFIEVNSTACQMTGYDQGELLDLGPRALGSVLLDHPQQTYELLVAGHPSETHIRRRDGSRLKVEIQQQAKRFGSDWIIACVMRDLSDREAFEDRQLHHDALTGLPNRGHFQGTLEAALSHAACCTPIVVMQIGVDRLNAVNADLGHATGDAVLCSIGNRLLNSLRPGDALGRLDGDEFALMLPMGEADAHQGAAAIASELRELLNEPFDITGQQICVTASMGTTIYPEHGSDSETLLQHANTAMGQAKLAGRDTCRAFSARMNAKLQARSDLNAALAMALSNEEFVLHYQPKVQAGSGRIVGLEALLRWQRPGHGLIPPNEFVPLLEESGQIVEVGQWVIVQACRQIASWKHSPMGGIPVAVNVSGHQFLDGELYVDVAQALRDHEVEANLLDLELTESSLMANTEHTVVHLQTLQDLGVQITIDDFGTGFSSLAYISQFPINKLKLDTSFVRNMTTNDDDAAIALAVIRMAHSLDLEVVAEGVETAAQLADLQQKGCDQIQGYYVSTPLPVEELERMLREWRGVARTTRATPTEHHHETTRRQGKAFSTVDQLA